VDAPHSEALELEPPAAATADVARLPLPTSILGHRLYYGWYIVAVAFVASMMSAGVQAYTLGVFLKPMTAELGWTRTDISLGQTVSTVVGAGLGVLIGSTLDRRGGRALMIAGAVVSGLGFIALGQVHELWHYYAVRGGLITVGSVGMGALVVNVALSNWFVRMRGRAIAIGAMGISVAALVLPSLSTRVIDAFGWRAAWAVIGVLIWLIVIPLVALAMRRRPEDHGLAPDGDRSGAPPRRLRVFEAGDVRWTRRTAARTPTLWLLILTFGFANTGLGAMLLHLVPYLTDLGFSPGTAAVGFSMIGLAGLVSKPLWGLALERIATRYCASAEFLLMSAGIALIVLIGGVPSMFFAILVFGLGIGGVITVQELIWANYFGRLTLGTVRSLAQPFTIASSASGPVLAGVAYDLGGSYRPAFWFFAATYLAAAVLILFTPTPKPPSGGV